MRWSKLSVGTKFTALTMTVCIAALALFGAGIWAYARVGLESAQLSGGVLLIGLASAAAAALVLSVRLQRIIAGPILQLSHTTQRISSIGDYRVRAEKRADDELGHLVDQFNELLAQIERREVDLAEMRNQLEDRVRERTKDLELEVVERRRNEEELIMAKTAAEEASIAKNTFLANMSHELRTPLNAILGYSEMLKEDAEDRGATQDMEDLDRIIIAGRHLLLLINAVLDLSKIEAGQVDRDVEPFDLAQFLQGVVEVARPLAAKNNNELNVGPLDGLAVMKSDQTKVQQILINLLGNACKFTTDGQVKLDVSRGGDLSDVVVFKIQDTGIGISREQQDQLFRDFSQADSSAEEQGTGLGLAISQRLCRLLGGTIELESTLGAGSTFTVRLPAELEETTVAPPSGDDFEGLLINSHPADPADSSTPVVLVIDDDASARDLASRVIGRAGFRVIEASTAEDGLQLVKTFPLAAIILETALREVDGWAVFRRIKKMPEGAAVPVIVTSVTDEPVRSVALGAVEHLTKPYESIELIRILRQAVASPRDASDAPSMELLVAAAGTTARAAS